MSSNKEIKSVQMLENNIFCTGSKGLIAKSTNNGNSWLNLSFDTAKQINSCYFILDSKGFAVCSGGYIYVTTNLGNSWSPVSSGTSNDLNRISFFDSNNGIIIGKSGVILRTSNGGNSWALQSNSYSYDLNDICFVSKDTVYISGNNGLILASKNGGASWHRQNANTSGNLKAIAFFDRGSGIVTGDDAGFYVTSKGEIEENGGNSNYKISRVDNKMKKNSYKLSQNYPNPFNPVTEIRYSVGENSKVELKIYNILGQEVTELVNDYKTAGDYTAKFDGSRFASGIYFYRIIVYDRNSSNIKYSETKKMLLIK